MKTPRGYLLLHCLFGRLQNSKNWPTLIWEQGLHKQLRELCGFVPLEGWLGRHVVYLPFFP